MVCQKLLKYDTSHNWILDGIGKLWYKKIKLGNHEFSLEKSFLIWKITYTKVGTPFPRIKIKKIYSTLNILAEFLIAELPNVKKRVLSSPTLHCTQKKSGLENFSKNTKS